MLLGITVGLLCWLGLLGAGWGTYVASGGRLRDWAAGLAMIAGACRLLWLAAELVERCG